MSAHSLLLRQARAWRRTLGLCGLLALAGLAGLGLPRPAASASFALDEDLMRSIEDTTKSLDSNLVTQDGKAAALEAQELVQVFALIEAYYAARPDGQAGVTHARSSQQWAQQTLSGVQQRDFNAAGESLQRLTGQCKACHQVYRKP